MTRLRTPRQLPGDDDTALRELAVLAGLGPTTAAWLLAIGIRSAAELEDRLDPDDGALDVYLELRASRPGVSLNALWVLEALRRGCSWQDVPEERKAVLRGRVNRVPRGDSGRRA